MSEWQEVTLDSVAIINPTESLRKGQISKKIAMDALQPFTKKPASFSLEEFNGGMKFRNGDKIVARITPCLENGKTAYIDLLDENEVSFGSTEYIVLRERNGISDKQFLYYFSISPIFRDVAILSMTGCSGRQRVQTDVVEKHLFDIPPLPEQKAITAMLSSIDDKIDLLHRQNQTLEAMAGVLFRQRFVEDVQEAWDAKPLNSIANFLNGLACQKIPPKNALDRLPVLKIRELSSGISDSSDWATSDIKSQYIVENGDVIFAWPASLMVKVWDGGKCVLNQHLFKVTSDEFPKWFYLGWCRYHLKEFIAISASHATTMGHIKRGDLDATMVVIPSDSEINAMSEKMVPLLDKQIANAKQIKLLEKLRDTLLPKLMSGEVRLDYD
ncbi:MAG: type I restriction endonuclease subunit S [Ferrovum sp. 37-45-19]|nr:MAG: type I restriction endonuclease subunit S [Ferrovum sp. 21-44-67]OYV95312.1 MAG: type I restriction endonuclease subunit S [Ferrovum sp. 37-45-19]OZB32765.1 MAG: type I restriction endonuclease subunit S [Ferrovum sp. 34-44-207]HQT82401.1 restriction endonuclease subunit S [Ferrovaceae bacterium]HQU07382.1 restriction endonuclease subunit S [Ferrovaceae bacterium]